MLRFRRVLDAVTVGRVVALLLLAGFAQELFSLLTWLVSLGLGLSGVPALRACLSAAVELGVEAVVIYLALHGLGSMLERRRQGQESIGVGPATGGRGSPASTEGARGVGGEEGGRPREGGDGGHGPRLE